VPFDFNALLHTYYRVEEKISEEFAKNSGYAPLDNVKIAGLAGANFMDKVPTQNEEKASGMIVKGETDRVYKNSPDLMILKNKSNLLLLGKKAKLTDKNGSSEELPADVVVWNPWAEKAKKMGDFGDAEYHEMMCVEPGRVSEAQQLAPGAVWEITQTVTAASAL